MSLLVAKKKTKKKALINMGKRFKGPARQVQVVEDSSEEDENQDEDARRTRARVVTTQSLRIRTILTNNIHRLKTSISNWRID